jgi:hypothetical protein
MESQDIYYNMYEKQFLIKITEQAYIFAVIKNFNKVKKL